MNEPQGPWQKILRAKEHLDFLNREIGAFIASKPYRIAIEKDPEDGSDILCPYLRENLPINWGIVLGECVHALRSTLDQIAWVVATGRDRFTSYPIALDERDKNFITRLNRLREDAREDIKATQPYTRPDRPRNHPLWVLSRVDNIDKHRVILPGVTTLYVATGLKSPKWFFMDGFTRLNKGDVQFKLVTPSNANPNFKPEMRGQITFDISEPPRADADPARLFLRDVGAMYDFVRNDVYPRFARFIEK